MAIEQQNFESSLTVIMPVFNEEKTIVEIITKVCKQRIVGELLVIDDGSTDGTRKKLDEFKNNSLIKIIYHLTNNGKGAAIADCREFISLPYVIIQDADLELNPEEYEKILEPLLSERADAVFGSRFINRPSELIDLRYIGNRLMTIFSNMFTGLALTDVATCYKSMKSSIFKNMDLKERSFSIDAEITMWLAVNKHKVLEVPISYAPRSYGEGKKIRNKDALHFFYAIIKYFVVLRFKKRIGIIN